MAGITSLSPQSSIYSLVNSLTQIARQPIVKLEQKRSDLEMRNLIYSDLKTKLSSLHSIAEGMTDPLDSSLEARSTSVADTDVFTASATSLASLGSHSIFVSQLAKHHTMVSNQFTSDADTLRTQVGVGDSVISLTINGVTTEVTVTVDADDTNEDILDKTASAINFAMLDIDDSATATSMNDTSTTSKLAIRSSQTGETYKVDIEDVTGTLASALGISDEAVAATGTTGGYIYADSELNAQATVDGIDITRDSNILDDIITGVTITLKGSQSDSADPVELTINPDTSSIRSTVEDLLEKYNDALSYLKTKTAVSEDGTRSVLSTEFMYRGLIGSLRTVAAGVFTTGSEDIRVLADLGITADATGELSISDTDDFEDAIGSSPRALAELFKGTGGFASQIESLLDPYVDTGGYIDTNTTNVTSKIKYVNESIERLEVRATAEEERLIAQYSSLQEMLAMLSQQQNFLASFLQGQGY